MNTRGNFTTTRNPARRQGIRSYWVLTLLWLLSVCLLPAQAVGDEIVILRHYRLPEEAVLFETLTVIDSIAYYEGKPFDGIAYERYSNRQLSRVQRYSRGLKHGYMYVWYSDGKPQLSTSYRWGRLNGRFIGWYPNGSVIYDIILNQGRFAGDYLYDDDETRVRTETEVTEGEGNIGDGQQD